MDVIPMDGDIVVEGPEQEAQSAPRRPHISASTEFPVAMPYDAAFAERIPLVQAFRFALAHAMAVHGEQRRDGGAFWVAECGVYRGRALRALALVADEMRCPVKFIGLDSFEGLPDLSAQDLAAAPAGARYLSEVMFADTTEREVLAYLEGVNADRRISLIRGFFDQSLSNLPERQYAFVNIDCDLYEGHLQCLDYFYSRMLAGGIIFLDDYYSTIYPMARRATDVFLADKPEHVIALSYGADGPPKAMIVKA